MLITYGKDKKHDISREKFLEIIDIRFFDTFLLKLKKRQITKRL